MTLRASSAFLLSCLACANARDDSESKLEGAARDPTGGANDTQRPKEPEAPGPPECPLIAFICDSEFSVALEAAEPWPLGRYFLRVAVDRGPPTVCEIAFEAVVGAVTDTCNAPDRSFRVTYRYDDEVRGIEEVTFGGVRRVDMEILVAENLPPLVEVHHDVVRKVRKCSYACEAADSVPLVTQVLLGNVAGPSVDAGADDAGQGERDATVEAGL